MTAAADLLLELRDLRVRYQLGKAQITAVDGVSLSVKKGETVGLVGESGCGKTTLGKAVLRLVPITGGEIRFEARDVTSLGGSALRETRRKMQMIFQDPSASLNPRKTVRQLLEGPLRAQGLFNRKEAAGQVAEILGRVGLSEAILQRFPHEFSGGQKQRIGIARALVLRPALVVCDEPVSALDVSVQAQILNLLVDLKRLYSLSYLFISHDLGVVRYIADRVIVMYMGKVVESADRDALWTNPQHPYTKTLIAAVPGQKGTSRLRKSLGEVPSSNDAAGGCRFYARCTFATDICRSAEPVLTESANGNLVACHNATRN